RNQRLGHLLYFYLMSLIAVVFFGLTFALLAARIPTMNDFMSRAYLFLGPLILLVATSVIFRGGVAMRLVPLHLVQADGSATPRWRCAWRTLLGWGLPILLLGSIRDMPRGAELALLAATALIGLVFIIGAFIFPERTPLDRLAGTYTVPK